MKKNYVYILLTFIAMQLSVFIGTPLFFFIGVKYFQVDPNEMEVLAVGYWLIFSFLAGLAIILFLLRKREKVTKIDHSEPLPVGSSILWAVGGIFLALFAQIIAALIERGIGIEAGSENTQEILAFMELFPLLIVVSSLLGPIIEEIVFRKVLFGTLYNRFPFWISALLSSIVFALAHLEPVHIILYSAMGFVFSYLYVKTKRIIVPIFAHVMMNTLVVLMQRIPIEDLEKKLDSTVQAALWIGGLFA